jgi:hypothetical protein
MRTGNLNKRLINRSSCKQSFSGITISHQIPSEKKRLRCTSHIKTANRFNAFKKTTFMITDAILKFVPFFSPEELNDVFSLKKNTSKKKNQLLLQEGQVLQ